MIVLGVDSSLTSTGLAYIDTDTGEWTTSRVRTKPTKTVAAQAARMLSIADEVIEVAAYGGLYQEPAELVVIEGLSFGSRGNATRDLAGVWWRVVTDLVREGFELLVVTPQTRAKYAAGSTKADKHDVLAAVRSAYLGADVPNHDVADAVALAALGARVKGSPVEASPLPWQVEVAEQIARREAEKGK